MIVVSVTISVSRQTLRPQNTNINGNKTFVYDITGVPNFQYIIQYNEINNNSNIKYTTRVIMFDKFQRQV